MPSCAACPLSSSLPDPKVIKLEDHAKSDYWLVRSAPSTAELKKWAGSPDSNDAEDAYEAIISSLFLAVTKCDVRTVYAKTYSVRCVTLKDTVTETNPRKLSWSDTCKPPEEAYNHCGCWTRSMVRTKKPKLIVMVGEKGLAQFYHQNLKAPPDDHNGLEFIKENYGANLYRRIHAVRTGDVVVPVVCIRHPAHVYVSIYDSGNYAEGLYAKQSIQMDVLYAEWVRSRVEAGEKIDYELETMLGETCRLPKRCVVRVDTVAKAQALKALVKKRGWAVIDTETAPCGWQKKENKYIPYFTSSMVCIGIGHEDCAYVTSMSAPKPVLDIIRSIVEDRTIEIVYQNGKFDIRAFKEMTNTKWDPAPCAADTMLMAFAFDTEARVGLEYQAELIGLNRYKDIIKEAQLEAGTKDMSKVNYDVLEVYNALDVVVTARVYLFRKFMMRFMPQTEKFFGILMDLLPSIMMMEEGVRVDRERLHKMYMKNELELEQATKEFFADPKVAKHYKDKELEMVRKKWKGAAHLTTHEEMIDWLHEKDYFVKHEKSWRFNPNNPDQMRWLMYQKLGYPVYGQTKGGEDASSKKDSTAAIVIDRLAEEGYPVAKMLVKIRGFATLKSQFFEPLLFGGQVVDLGGGRHWVFPSWKQTGTATGRLANAEPGLQKMPKALKPAFLPDEDDCVIVDADLSQIELRFLALLGEEVMQRLFKGVADSLNAQADVAQGGKRATLRMRAEEFLKKITDDMKVMSGGYRRGIDLHILTAYRFYYDPKTPPLQVPKEHLAKKTTKVTKVQRGKGKRTNFGIIFGIGPKKLMAQSAQEGAPMELKEAMDFIQSVKKTYPCYEIYHDYVLNVEVRRGVFSGFRVNPRENKVFFDRDKSHPQKLELLRRFCLHHDVGYAHTAHGLSRSMFEIFDSSSMKSSGAEREAFNTPIQGLNGIATQILARQLILECQRRSKKNKEWGRVRLLTVVHDSIVSSVPKVIAQEYAYLVHEFISKLATFPGNEIIGDFPIDGSVEVGFRWGETVPLNGDDKPDDVLLMHAGDGLKKAISLYGEETWHRQRKSSPVPRPSPAPFQPPVRGSGKKKFLVVEQPDLFATATTRQIIAQPRRKKFLP